MSTIPVKRLPAAPQHAQTALADISPKGEAAPNGAEGKNWCGEKGRVRAVG